MAYVKTTGIIYGILTMGAFSNHKHDGHRHKHKHKLCVCVCVILGSETTNTKTTQTSLTADIDFLIKEIAKHIIFYFASSMKIPSAKFWINIMDADNDMLLLLLLAEEEEDDEEEEQQRPSDSVSVFRSSLDVRSRRLRQGKIRRRSLLPPNESAFAKLFDSAQDDALVTICGFDHALFALLHSKFKVDLIGSLLAAAAHVMVMEEFCKSIRPQVKSDCCRQFIALDLH